MAERDWVERVDGGYVWHRGMGYDVEFGFDDEARRQQKDSEGNPTVGANTYRSKIKQAERQEIIANAAIAGASQELDIKTDREEE